MRSGSVRSGNSPPESCFEQSAAWRSGIWPTDRRNRGVLNMSDIAKRVSDVVVAKLHIPADRVTQAASFIDDLAATSLDVVETIMALEDEFAIEISDRDAEHLQTVGDVVALITTKLHFRGVSDAATGAGAAAIDR